MVVEVGVRVALLCAVAEGAVVRRAVTCGCPVGAVGAVDAAGAALWHGAGLPCAAFELGVLGMCAAAVVASFLLAAWDVWEEI